MNTYKEHSDKFVKQYFQGVNDLAKSQALQNLLDEIFELGQQELAKRVREAMERQGARCGRPDQGWSGESCGEPDKENGGKLALCDECMGRQAVIDEVEKELDV